jgi:hypothetical protein
MASTYVNDLRLNEMATGDASGSWGTVTNTNLELIGEAFSYGTETIGDADSTLTIADGAADAARSFYLKITSSVDLTTTRIVTLAPNTVSKVWMIENATTGSQVITIKQGSGATINVPNGQVKMISTDGAGSGGAVLDLLVDVDLTGTTTLVNLDVSGTALVTGVLTTTAATVFNGGFTANADSTLGTDKKVQFRDAAIYINSSVDGQLDIVADTEIQIAATTVDLNGNLDVSGTLGVTGVLTATSLDISGDIDVDGTTNLDVVDIDGAVDMASTLLVTGVLTTTAATVSNGGGQFNGAINVGVDDTGYDVKFFGATAGAYMLWDESADDLILGGAAGLSVNSTALVTGVLTTTAATVHTGGITMPDNAKAIFGAGSDLEIYHNGTNSIISDEGAGALVVQSNGSGIYLNNGVSENMLTAVIDGAVTLYHDNAAKLATTATGIDVTGAAAFTGGISIDGQNASTPGLSEKTDLDTGIFWPTANTIAVSTAGAERMRIDSEGRLGLNITPSATTAFTVFQNRYLSLYGFDQSQSHILTNTYYPVDNGDYKRQATGTAQKLSMNNGNYQFNIGASGAADSVIAFNQAMTLDSSGNLLVGTTVARTGTASITIEGGNSYQQFRAAGTSSLQQVSFYRNTAVTPVEVGAISTTGTATTYATSSDYRLKTDAQPMVGASARVLALKPVNFEWISSGERVDGFLAHEAQAIVPECVTGTKDAMRDEEYEVTAAVEATYDDDGNELTAAVEAVMGTRSVPDMQGIDQSKLVPLLTAALQEALTKIADMEIRLSALEG